MFKVEEQQQLHLRTRISSASEEVQVLRMKLEQVRCDNDLFLAIANKSPFFFRNREQFLK